MPATLLFLPPPRGSRRLRRQSRLAARRPVLRFTPDAWAKLVFLRDLGPTEVGAFGISDSDDRLLVTDLALVPQQCSPVSVRFDDGAVADYFDAQVDLDRQPESFGRIWIHTHPGRSPLPSGTDEETFARVFGRPDWAVMFILARGGECYARLRINAGPGAELCLRAAVDFEVPLAGSDEGAWEAEYHAKVTQEPDWLDAWPVRAQSPFAAPPGEAVLGADGLYEAWGPRWAELGPEWREHPQESEAVR